MRDWDLSEVEPGDYVEVQVYNKRGDRNLDGMVIYGKVKEVVPEYDMARLESGWCVHTKDDLIVLRKK